jgi:UPF0716 protein FxsA
VAVALFVLFIVVPIVELAVIIQVGQAIGALNTIALLILVGVVGAWLAKREGLAVYGRFRRQVEAGVVPGREIADGFMILMAGAMLLTPGFVTDVLALLLLLPPVRAAIRASVLHRVTRRVHYRRGRYL